MKMIMIILTMLFVSVNLHAQVDGTGSDKPISLGRNVLGLGGTIGLVSGIGVSFRHHFPSILSYQLVGGIIKFNKNLHYDIGVEIQADILRGRANRFYACGGAGYFFSGEVGQNDLTAPWRFGIGVGNEWANINQFHVAGEVLITYFEDGTVIPIPQLGVHYYFF